MCGPPRTRDIYLAAQLNAGVTVIFVRPTVAVDEGVQLVVEAWALSAHPGQDSAAGEYIGGGEIFCEPERILKRHRDDRVSELNL